MPWKTALALGLGAATVEVALRMTPKAGLGWVDVGVLLGVAALLSCGFLLVVAVVAGRTSRPHALLWGAMMGMQLAINYRFEVVLNEFVRDPKVFVGVPAAFVLGAVPWLFLERWLARLSPWVVASVGLLGAAAAFLRIEPASVSASGLPNVLIVSLDTLRMDRTGPYGHRIATPNLDRLAREGAVFEQAIAEAPITEPSHLAMLTGISPYTSGVVANGTVLGERPALLWHTLEGQGYATAGFVSGFPLHGKYDWSQGIDVWDDDFGVIGGVQALSLVKCWNQVAIREHALRERTADRVLSRALPWLSRHREQSFFAFVHFYDAHGPYDAHGKLPEPNRSGSPLDLPFYWPAPDRAITDVEWLKQAYDKEVEYVDDAVGQLLTAIGPALDQTIVILTADHGESFLEHDYLFDHGDNLYDPSLRIPLIVRYPAKVKAGLRVPCQVGGVDVVPTILELLGQEDAMKRDGRSLAGVLAGATCVDTPVYSSTVAGRMVEVPPVAHSRRWPKDKVIFYTDRPPEYFDLIADPGETVSLDNGMSRDAFGELMRTLEGGGQVQGVAMDAETRAMLEQLGYIEAEREQ